MAELISLSALEFQDLLGDVITPYPAAGFTMASGPSLLVKYQALPDIAALGTSALTSHQYLQLRHGDVALTNDPYSGGSTLNNFFMAVGIDSSGKGGRADILLSRKVSFKPRIFLSSKIDEEGLRVPPSPLRSGGENNKGLLDAIANHPLAPAKLLEDLTKAKAQLEESADHFLRHCRDLPHPINAAFLKKYQDLALQNVRSRLGDLPHGEVTQEMELAERTRIRLRFEVQESKVVFDFTGTDASPRYSITDTATMGTCLGALVALFNDPIPITGGLFRAVEVIAPSGTMVNCKYPSPVFFGISDTTALIGNLILKAVGKIDSRFEAGAGGVSQCSVQLDFKDRSFFDTLETGSAASKNRSGASATSIWRRSHLNPSVEEMEARYPLLIKSFAIRAHSGGSGHLEGGDGTTKSYQVLEDCTATYVIGEPYHKPEGGSGGKSGSGAEVTLQRPGQERLKLPSCGKRDLKAGDILTLHSSGGGGFGDEPSPS